MTLTDYLTSIGLGPNSPAGKFSGYLGNRAAATWNGPTIGSFMPPGSPPGNAAAVAGGIGAPAPMGGPFGSYVPPNAPNPVAPASPAAVPPPQPRPAQPNPGAPLNLAPPNPGPTAPPPGLFADSPWGGTQPGTGMAPGGGVPAFQGAQNSPVNPAYLQALAAAKAPQQGLLPKLVNDIGGLSKLWGGSGGATSPFNVTGSLY